MTHPPNVCSHCENGRDPVTDRNGYTFIPIAAGVLLEMCLHVGCADAWCRDFNSGMNVEEARVRDEDA
jgi:hypothetical protein